MNTLAKGDRVKLSNYAIERRVRWNKEGVLGTVQTEKSPSSVSFTVLWDDRKTTDRLHEHFLEKVLNDHHR